MFKFLKTRSKQPQGPAAEFLARSGPQTSAPRLPAWALLLHSPFNLPSRAGSWIGGLPSAPAGFQWPTDDGASPMLFLAQIDLAELGPVPGSGARAPGLPEQGSLLVFIGSSYACFVLSQDEAARARTLVPPDGLPSPDKFGFFCDQPTLPRWPVRPAAFLDEEREDKDKFPEDGARSRPTALPDPFARPEDWIVNWGLAALDAEIAIDCLTKERARAEWQVNYEKGLEAQGKPLQQEEWMQLRRVHYAFILQETPALLDSLTGWHNRAIAAPPEHSVDRAALRAIYDQRRAFADAINGSYKPKLVLPGRAGDMWYAILRRTPDLGPIESFATLPPELRPFAEKWSTNWRGHDCLISIAADELLGTKSEHEYGLSIWIARHGLAHADYEEGQLVRHWAV